MAIIWHTMELSTWLPAETSPGLTVPTLLGSYWSVSGEPSESWQKASG